MDFSYLATERYRWIALVFIALGLAIVIIDNTVLNVAIPYILRDLNASFDGIQWVISGYALIIATLLITVGKLGDVWGRKKVFLLGTILFAVGSFVASISQNILVLFFGEALIEAIGASMMLTSSLVLLVSEFQGRERAVAFGVWGSVAGASATIGPLFGGFLTTYYSWRWSLRINVVIALIAIIGSIFIKESFGEKGEEFDFLGVLFSGIGLFCLIFGFIEGQRFGWITPISDFTLLGWHWPLSISIIPFVFNIAIIFLLAFIGWEFYLEDMGRMPLLRMSLFTNRTFNIGLITLFILALGQFGAFFIFPLYLQNVLGLTAFQTGLVFISSSIVILFIGPISGFLASRIGPKWIISLGMFFLAFGTYWLVQSIAVAISPWSLTPPLIVFGLGIGMSSAQLTNIILSGVPVSFSGEASGVNATIRQVGTSIGIAIIGVIFARAITTHIPENIQADTHIPSGMKNTLIEKTKNITPGKGQDTLSGPPPIIQAVKNDINNALVTASKDALLYACIFTSGGTLVSLLIPNIPQQKEEVQESEKKEEEKPEEKEIIIFVPKQKSAS